ncbi:EamA family transporter [bacterium]|nr:EamA family transporter [bacterium]
MTPVALAVLASVFWGVGTVLQKKGMAAQFPRVTLREMFARLPAIVRVLFTNRIWLFGFFLMMSGSITFTTAIGQGDLTLVQPCVALTGVFAASIGMTLLGERVRPMELAGIGLIIAGVVLVASANRPPTSAMPTLVALGGFIAVAGVVIFAALRAGRVAISRELSLSIAAGLSYGSSNLMGKFMTQRAVAEVGLPFAINRPEIWESAMTDYPLLLWAIFNALGTVFFQTAFANGRASVISPVVTIVSIVTPVLGAMAILGESMAIAQVAGIAIVVAGTAILAFAGGEEAKITAAE